MNQILYRLKGNIPDNFYTALEKLQEMPISQVENLTIDIGNGESVLVVEYENSGGSNFRIKYLSKTSIKVKIY